MAEDARDGTAGEEDAAPPPPRQGYIPRPPSPEAVDKLSEAQGMITDEWTGDARPAGATDEPPARPR